VRVSCVHIRPGPRCAAQMAVPEQLPAACETCEQYRGPSRGLGDVVAKVAKVTGADRVVKAVTGGDCGCGKRRAKLNRAVPFREGAD
jgi:hypothetical protein